MESTAKKVSRLFVSRWLPLVAITITFYSGTAFADEYDDAGQQMLAPAMQMNNRIQQQNQQLQDANARLRESQLKSNARACIQLHGERGCQQYINQLDAQFPGWRDD